jgi:hypothetical protein
LLLVTLPLIAVACDDTPPRPDFGRHDARLEWRFPDSGRLDFGATDIVPPGSDRCAGAAALTFVGNKISVKGTTAGAGNEYGTGVRCGETTPLVGPQRYYKLSLAEGNAYRILFKPDFAAVLYLASDCSANVINVDCGSGGATGEHSGPVQPGAEAVLYFSPRATGGYILGVDSAAANASGGFSLEIEEHTVAPNSTCASALAIPFIGGSATVQGSTLGSKNEFSQLIRCHLGVDFDGPQVYYAVDLTAGSWYRLTLAADFAASLYAFDKAANCKAENIETDCSGRTGTVLPLVPKGGSRATAFSPLTTGTFVVAVDSSQPAAAGQFTLSIESFSPPEGMTCATATPLSLDEGKATANGDTSRLLNDLGAHVSCSAATAPLIAPQAYFVAALKKTTYQVALKPSFPAVLAVGSSCLTLPVDCTSGGLTGTTLNVLAGTTGSLLFTPAAAGTYVIAVDGTSVNAAGPFSLVVQQYSPPTNGSCTQPKALALVQSPVQEVASTGPLANDLAGVSCGLSAGPWPGPQAYFRASLKAGKTYKVELTPEPTFDPSLYALSAATACTATAVNAACAGLASDKLGAGVSESLTLSPSVDQDYVIVVDSWSPSEVGTFTLTISW